MSKINLNEFKGHTPGPWTINVHKVGENISALLIESDMTTHSNCVLAEVEVENKYAEADAQLIAAAPELLADLIEACERIERLENALKALAQTAGDDPFFNEGGEGYEALFGVKSD